MSWDETYDEYHLTPHGWVKGLQYYVEPRENPERPNDCVITLIRHMNQSFPSARQYVDWYYTWKSSDYSEDEIEALQNKYPRPD